MPIDQAELSKLVDEKVRMLIGDLTMQTIVLRSILDMNAPENQPQQPHQPHPNPIPQPIPADNPTPPRTPAPQPAPTVPPQSAKNGNGGAVHPIRGA